MSVYLLGGRCARRNLILLFSRRGRGEDIVGDRGRAFLNLLFLGSKITWVCGRGCIIMELCHRLRRFRVLRGS